MKPSPAPSCSHSPFLALTSHTCMTFHVQRTKAPWREPGCTWECSSCTRSLASSSSCSDSLRVRSVCSRASFISSSSSSSRPLLRSVMASCSLRSSLLRRASSSCNWESCRGQQGWGWSPQAEGPAALSPRPYGWSPWAGPGLCAGASGSLPAGGWSGPAGSPSHWDLPPSSSSASGHHSGSGSPHLACSAWPLPPADCFSLAARFLHPSLWPCGQAQILPGWALAGHAKSCSLHVPRSPDKSTGVTGSAMALEWYFPQL